jgi:hypothetical protein
MNSPWLNCSQQFYVKQTLAEIMLRKLLAAATYFKRLVPTSRLASHKGWLHLRNWAPQQAIHTSFRRIEVIHIHHRNSALRAFKATSCTFPSAIKKIKKHQTLSRRYKNLPSIHFPVTIITNTVSAKDNTRYWIHQMKQKSCLPCSHLTSQIFRLPKSSHLRSSPELST